MHCSTCFQRNPDGCGRTIVTAVPSTPMYEEGTERCGELQMQNRLLLSLKIPYPGMSAPCACHTGVLVVIWDDRERTLTLSYESH
jgi:hypothetical protein